MAAENNCTSTHNFDGSERTGSDDPAYDEARRLRAFVELLRWSGMAISDAVQFRHELIDKNGALTYQRQKSKKTARPGILPAHVLEYLHTVPVGEGTPEQPFLKPNFKRKASLDRWRRRLTQLYKAAGIKKIKTDVGSWKSPKAHVLRDTFAVGLIREGKNSTVVAAALGDTTKMVEDHYSPWIEEMKTAQNEAIKDANKAQMERLDAMKEKMLAGGRNARSR
jgi:site-specific recombinase XerD